jgi:hypothetical protein
MLRHFSGPTHKDTDKLKKSYEHQSDYPRLRCVLSVETGGTAFSLGFLKGENIL